MSPKRGFEDILSQPHFLGCCLKLVVRIVKLPLLFQTEGWIFFTLRLQASQPREGQHTGVEQVLTLLQVPFLLRSLLAWLDPCSGHTSWDRPGTSRAAAKFLNVRNDNSILLYSAHMLEVSSQVQAIKTQHALLCNGGCPPRFVVQLGHRPPHKPSERSLGFRACDIDQL